MDVAVGGVAGDVLGGNGGAAVSPPSLSLWDRGLITASIGQVDPRDPAAIDTRIRESLQEHPDAWPLHIRHVVYLLNESKYDEAAAELETALQHADRQQVIAWLKQRLVVSSPNRFPNTGPALAAGIDPQDYERWTWCLDQLLQIAPNEPTALVAKLIITCQGGGIKTRDRNSISSSDPTQRTSFSMDWSSSLIYRRGFWLCGAF